MKTPEQELRDSLIALDPQRSWSVERAEWYFTYEFGLPPDRQTLIKVSMHPAPDGDACENYGAPLASDPHQALLTIATLALRPYIAPAFMFLP